MSFFEVYNDQGSLQFNAEVNAFYLAGKGSVTLAAGNVVTDYPTSSSQTGTNYQLYMASLVTAFDWDIVCFYSPDGFIVPYNFNGAASAPTARGITVYGSSACTVYYYCFRAMSFLAPSAHGVGLEIYDSTGSVLYSTTQRPVAVIQDFPIGSYSYAGTLSLPAGKSYAFMQYGNSSKAMGRSGFAPYAPYGAFYPSVKSIAAGAAFQAGAAQISINNGPPDGGGGMLILDVTGL